MLDARALVVLRATDGVEVVPDDSVDASLRIQTEQAGIASPAPTAEHRA
jgi:hypothetical protein